MNVETAKVKNKKTPETDAFESKLKPESMVRPCLSVNF
jgi:hypothetical protein